MNKTLRIQLNTAEKTIKLEGNVNLGEFYKQIKKLLPKDSPFGSWDEYAIETQTTISYWNNPIIVKEYVPYTPWWNTCTTGSYIVSNCTTAVADGGITYTSASTSDCIYNLEIEN